MAIVTLAEEDVDGIAAIHAVRADLAERALPTVFFFHGFNTSSKEITSYFGYMLARQGFRVVLPEADGHGCRFDGNRSARFERFWEIVARCIDELPRIRDHYATRGLIDGGRIGVGGTSMGGMVTCGAMARHAWVRAAACYMGAAHFALLARTLNPPRAEAVGDVHEHDPAECLERLGNRPLFVWHGERDDVVPYAWAARLRDELGERGLDRQLEFVGDPLGVHRVTHDAAAAGVQFFVRNL